MKPESEITDVTFWKTPNDFKLAANWFYASSLMDPQNGGTINNDNMSDIAMGMQPDQVSSGTYVAPAEDDVWNGAYSAIRNANKLIEQGENSEIKNDLLPYIGEGYFFRAYNYFNLLRSYGGVPIIEKVLTPGDPEVFGPRASREEVVSFILSDLDKAIAYLDVKGDTETGRICKEAAKAFKARICLFEGTWRKFHQTGDASSLLDLAVSESGDVINSQSYSLYKAKGEDSYRYLFIDQTSTNNPESIIAKHYRVNINYNFWTYGISWGEMNPTKKIADMYLCADGLPVDKSPLFQGYNTCRSEFSNRDPRMTQSLILPAMEITRPQFDTPSPQWPGVGNNRNINSGYMLYKFISEISALGSTAASNYDYNIMRYAEVLLIYAEAKFEKDGSISDDDLNISVNALRDRVQMPHLTNAFVLSSNLDMRTEIRRERAVELAFEGFRWDDLRRWKTAETELSKSLLSIKVTGTQWDAPTVTIDGHSTTGVFFNLPTDQLENGYKVLQPGSQRNFDPDKHYLLPLATKEISLNADLEQNPGW
ncbi:MAG: RagB/SusD family nutrient uptake outer membrane protein [Mangrovibacterium sp.]